MHHRQGASGWWGADGAGNRRLSRKCYLIPVGHFVGKHAGYDGQRQGGGGNEVLDFNGYTFH